MTKENEPARLSRASASDYDPIDDAWASVKEAYREIRCRVESGGLWWEPKISPQSTSPVDGSLCKEYESDS